METKIGDIFAVRLKRKGVYFVAQILSGNDAAGRFAVVLDLFTKEPPYLKEAAKLKPFYFGHHFWEREEFYLSTDEIINAEPVFIGNAAPICKPPRQASLQNTEQICMQLAWNELPKDIRDKFKSAHKQKLEIRQPQDREFYAEFARQNPFCYEIKSEIWDENLKDFLESTPMITNMELNCAAKSLDISRTYVQELTLDTSGIQEILLNDSLYRLTLKGGASRLKSMRCPFGGELLSVQLELKGGGFCVSGLEELRELRIFSQRGERVDLADVAASFPNLREIFINAQGGTLKNIDALAKLKRLQAIRLRDVYGFDSFPARAQLPHLKRLWLRSVPKTVCEAAKRQFKDIEDFEIKQPRSDQWLEANLNNPLRGWDGREGVSAAASKKAMKAYENAHKMLSAIKKEPETASKKAARTGKFDIASADSAVTRAKVLKEFIAVFNAVGAGRGIDTMEREEIWDAFCKLCELASVSEKDREKIWETNAEF
ncbi:MAG: hypothetical protein ACFNTA_05965 [Campylobacter sp.]|uniref:hypothetical protein n=1 Tax=Campylobacter sp. TaxID=205 RepID=UPI003621143A